MREIIRRPQAKIDLINTADYIAAQAGFNTSDKFLIATENAFKQLALMPGMGVFRNYDRDDLQNMRMWLVPTFPMYLIFYIADEETVEIIRVLHGAQNLHAAFSQSDSD